VDIAKNRRPMRLVVVLTPWSAHGVADEVVVRDVGVVLGGRVTVVVLGELAVVTGVFVVDVGEL
jgi:hypothetical protein